MDPYIRALMEDGLDSLLEEISDWTASQGEELIDSEDESDLLIAARRADQQGGNPLFAVNMQRVSPIFSRATTPTEWRISGRSGCRSRPPRAN